MEAAARPAGIGLVEDQAVQDLMEVAAGKPLTFRSATPGGAALAVIGVAGRYVQAVGAAVLVARFSVLLAVLLLSATLAVRRLAHAANVTQARAFEGSVPTYRRAGSYTGLAVTPGAAKEISQQGVADLERWLTEPEAPEPRPADRALRQGGPGPAVGS
jgi:ATP-binding cassette, subfamily B, bacterial